MSEDELHEANRGCWVLGRRADAELFCLFSYEGTVVQAMEIERIVEVPPRRALEGRVLKPGDPIFDLFVGGCSPVRARNPIGYFEHRLGQAMCWSGCGNDVPKGQFLPGHDQRAIHDLIAKIGTVADFIAWFDETWEEPDDSDDCCFEDSMALSSDVALAKDADGFEAGDGFAGAHIGSSDQSCRAFDCDHRDAGQDIEEQLDRRLARTRPSCSRHRVSSILIRSAYARRRCRNDALRSRTFAAKRPRR